MSQQLIAALEAGTQLHRASRLRKLIAIPGKLAYLKVIEHSGKIVKKTVPTFWGGEMIVVLPEQISMTIYEYGFLEYDLSCAFIDCLKPGMTFFDVGAHFGYFSCLAAHLVGPSGQVHSFEPTRSTFEILTENATLRSNIRTNNVAAYSRSTTIPFNDFGVAYSAFNSLSAARLNETDRSHLKPISYEITAISLDDYVQQSGAKPAVMKIDAESAELEILLGMERVLSEIKPIISVEVGDYALDGVAKSASVVQHLIQRGYQPHEWRDGALRPHVAQSQYAYGNLLFLPAT